MSQEQNNLVVGGGMNGSNLSGVNLSNQGSNIMNATNLNKLAEYCATNGDYSSAIEYY